MEEHVGFVWKFLSLPCLWVNDEEQKLEKWEGNGSERETGITLLIIEKGDIYF